MIFINEMFPSLCPSIYTDRKFQSVYIEGIIVRKEYMIKKKKKKWYVIITECITDKINPSIIFVSESVGNF
jgi:hypothetical protein